MTLPEVVGAGVFVCACVLLLGVTRVINIFNTWVPLSIVRGIQLAVGLSLAEKVRRGSC
jgi:predicted benzoate:H+ symporter BenE